MRGDVRERGVTVVAIQLVAAERRDIHVFPAVAVNVGGADTHAPAWMAETRFVGDVLERAVAAIPHNALRAARGSFAVSTVSESTK